MMSGSYLIVQASARSEGNTAKIARSLQKELSGDLIDLKKYRIGDYSYGHEHQNDDFLPVMRRLVEYDTIVFVSPVYWYTMSGLLKNFFDRFTDCLKIEKETGRKLRGKNMAAVSCGSDGNEVEGYFIPFVKSAEYLGMNYLGNLHTWVEGGVIGEGFGNDLRRFILDLNAGQH